ncbi:MAG: hypothetical protein OEW12_04700 [Deltaproteobacteria bacterium]|nr:hypothetical protein [Deltaproteobacteria bacterium]
MKHLNKWFSLFALLTAYTVGTAPMAQGETFHLTGGDTIKGRIISTDDQTISVESDKGFGIIQIPRSDISMIEFDNSARDPSHMMGIGYYHRSTPVTASGITGEYGMDAFSLKYWLDSNNAADILVGFFSSSANGVKNLEVYSFDMRYNHVFTRKTNLDVYWGLSAGYLSIVDNTSTTKVNATGYTARVTLGVEIFFVTLPNLGMSAEVGVGTQTVGNVTTTNISSSSFPSFSMRYYF